MSQGDIEKRTGLLRCYISRVENGHTVPAIETIEKMARALEVPMYQVFYDGDKPPELPNLPKRKTSDDRSAVGAEQLQQAAHGFVRRFDVAATQRSAPINPALKCVHTCASPQLAPAFAE